MKPSQEITTRKASADKMVHDFRQAFYTRFGIMPKVIYNIDSMSRVVHGLEVLENISNELLEEKYPGRYEGGIKNSSQEHDLCLYKFLFCFVAKDIGWHWTTIAKHLKYQNHSSALHSYRKFEHLMEQREMEALILHSEFMTRLRQNANSEQPHNPEQQ